METKAIDKIESIFRELAEKYGAETAETVLEAVQILIVNDLLLGVLHLMIFGLCVYVFNRIYHANKIEIDKYYEITEAIKNTDSGVTRTSLRKAKEEQGDHVFFICCVLVACIVFGLFFFVKSFSYFKPINLYGLQKPKVYIAYQIAKKIL